MTLLRGQILTTAPLALIAVCYAIAAPSSSPLQPPALPSVHRAASPPDTGCQAAADRLATRLPKDWGVIVRPPYVIAGDVSEGQLATFHRDTIVPTARSLTVQYFDRRPAWPVSIIICSSEDSYRECHACLKERGHSEYSGIYSRTEHRIVVNIATGEGTLAHELTHALAHADFPDLPEWLDEGLASLYEECEFSSDGVRLIGLPNWRGAVLQGSCRAGQLRPVAEMASDRFAAEDASTEYAQARYFCLFLQKRGLLEAFYRKCRANSKSDPSGMDTLAELLGSEDLEDIDRQFLSWFKTQKPAQ